MIKIATFAAVFTAKIQQLVLFLLSAWNDDVTCMCVCGSSSDVTLLAGIIVLEEFCKELAAIAFTKHYADSTS